VAYVIALYFGANAEQMFEPLIVATALGLGVSLVEDYHCVFRRNGYRS
jgi:hypothetical protein